MSRLSLFQLSFCVLVLAVFLTGQNKACADVGFFGSYVGVSINGANDHYNLTGAPGSSLSNFHGNDFGDFVVGTNSLTFTHAEGLTFKNSGGDVTGVQFNYAVTPFFTLPTFTEENVGFTANATFTDIAGLSFSGFGDQRWADSSGFAPIDILSGLSNGDYQLHVYMKLTSNEGDHFHSNSGFNYVANFSVVPEPTSLLMFGSLVAFTFRRRRDLPYSD